MKCKFVLFLNISLLFLTFNLNDSFAKTDSTKKQFYEIIGDDFLRAGRDYIYIFSSFQNFDRNNAAIIAGVGGFTCLSAFADNAIRKEVLAKSTKQLSDFFSIPNSFGAVQYPVALAGGIYLTGLFAGEKELRTTGRLIFESMALAGLTTTVTKALVGRSRPYMNNGQLKFKPFTFDDGFSSFPSGHTTAAFSVASVLATRIDKWWAYIGLYSCAGLTGIARIYFDKHNLSDVIVGAAIGTASGLAVCNAEMVAGKKETSQLLIYPTLNGLGFSYIMK